MKDSAIIVSGGMDSITMLYEYKDIIGLAITFDYGSNHAEKEISYAKLHCEKLGVEHIIIPLKFIHTYFKSSLLEGAEAIPEGKTSVGTELNISHIAATPVGLQVRATAEVTAVEGSMVTFKVEAFDETGKIGEGTHKRAVVTTQRFLDKTYAKL